MKEKKFYKTMVTCVCNKTYETNLKLNQEDITTCPYCNISGFYFPVNEEKGFMVR